MVSELLMQPLCRIKNKNLPRYIYSISPGASLVCLVDIFARVELGCAASSPF